MNADLQTLIALIILGLGTARMTALITLDEITEPMRDMLFHYFPPEDNEARGTYYQSYRKATKEERERLSKMKGRTRWWQRRFEFDPKEQRKPAFIGRLISCHKCVGVWAAGCNVGAYLMWPEPVFAINFALAAAFTSIILIGRYWR